MHDFRDAEPLALNPYQAPLEVPGRKAEYLSQESMAAWERLRLWYNAILAGEVLLCMGPFALSLVGKGLLAFMLECVLAANVCFCAGHVAEYYLGWIGFRGTAVRWGIFTVGTALSMLLTLAAIGHFIWK